MKTIAAISTATGNGGIGIVRLSGENAFSILEKVFVPKNSSTIKPYTIKYGHIVDKGEIIDEVLVSYFVAPKSYTTEDMCEINSHGSFVVLNRILNLCLKNGATLAEPGEFTKRAFLNGRIDLSQAESVMDIIHAKSEKERQAAVNQLDGYLSNEIHQIKKKVLDLLSDIEATIDYPEYDIEEVTNQKALKALDTIEQSLNQLEQSFQNGKLIKNGIKTAIIGKPNVGKSSLLNMILKEDRAIVSQYEGTTRDSIEEDISVNGIPIRIIDTAGIRHADDEIEKIGIEKAKEIADSADLIIALFDYARPLSNEDKEIIQLIRNKKAILVCNKADKKNQKFQKEILEELQKPMIDMSIIEKKGIHELYDQITKMFRLNDINVNDEVVITNIRHVNLIREAEKNLKEARKTIQNNMPIDIISINIKEIIEALNAITGENATEDIIQDIFRKFCLGK